MDLSSPSRRYNHKGKQQRCPGSCENMVAMVPHQHLRSPGKKKKVSEGRLYVNRIPSGETLKTCVEEWIDVCGDSSEGQNTINALVRITTTAHDDEHHLGRLTLPKTTSRRFTNGAFSDIRKN